jgi:hypothetical protein
MIWLRANWKLVVTILSVVLSMLAGMQLPSVSTPSEPEMAASVCSINDCAVVKANALKYSTTPTRILNCCLFLMMTGCPPTPPPQPPPVPVAVGGQTAAGGAVATGGVSSSTGGSTVAYLPPPTCDGAQNINVRALRPLLTGWKPNPRRAELLRDNGAKAREIAPVSPVWRSSVKPAPLTQRVGSCTGNAAANDAGMAPFSRILTEDDAEECYSIATRFDNGCTWNATSCNGAWYPARPTVNDNGSYGASALQAAVKLGWFRSWSAVPNVATLIQRLQSGPCMIGATWFESNFTPSTKSGECGKIVPGGRVAGGHETATAGYIPVRLDNGSVEERFYQEQSWGNHVAACDPNRPEYCAYFYWLRQDLEAMVRSGDAEIDCPDTPSTIQ